MTNLFCFPATLFIFHPNFKSASAGWPSAVLPESTTKCKWYCLVLLTNPHFYVLPLSINSYILYYNEKKSI